MKWLVPIFVFHFFVACSPKSADDYNTGKHDSQIISLFNKGEYGRAVWLMENEYGKDPADPQKAFLLAQAYLGKAGFEPLAFAARASSAQDPSLDGNQAIFPACPNESLRNFQETEAKCWMKRAFVNAPPADLFEFRRARELFRRAFPDPATSPGWVNTLIGVVETVSVVRRVGDLYLISKGTIRKDNKNFVHLGDPKWIRQQATEAVHEAAEALRRANYSSDKISKLLTGARQNIWFQRGEAGIQFADRIGLPRFLDFLRENFLSPTEEIRYGEMIDKIRTLLGDEEKELAQALKR